MKKKINRPNNFFPKKWFRKKICFPKNLKISKFSFFSKFNCPLNCPFVEFPVFVFCPVFSITTDTPTVSLELAKLKMINLSLSSQFKAKQQKDPWEQKASKRDNDHGLNDPEEVYYCAELLLELTLGSSGTDWVTRDTDVEGKGFVFREAENTRAAKELCLQNHWKHRVNTGEPLTRRELRWQLKAKDTGDPYKIKYHWNYGSC